jgi:hypothetical protein
MMHAQTMPLTFSMRLPLARDFRSIGLDVVRKYAELAGGGSADGDELVASIAGAVESVSAGVSADEAIDLDFAAGPDGLAVTLRCAGKSAVVKRTLHAPL